MSKKYQALYDAIKASSNVLIVPHKYPDGDSLGSALALYIALKRNGKNVWLISHTPIPNKYQFLAENYTFLPLELVTNNLDLIIGVDCADKERLNLSDDYLKRAKIVVNIDHHVTNDHFGHINIIQPVAATGEIIVDIFDDFGFEIDQEIATCLYTAISTDTGNFMYSNTSSSSFSKTARLFDTGFEFVDIARRLFLEKSLPQTRLIGRAIRNIEMYENDEMALISVSRDDMNELGAKEGDCETLVNLAVDIETVRVAVFIREITKSFFKVSFRSKGDYDVAKTSQVFGGGGHKNAAGCAVNGDFDTVKNHVISVVKDMFFKSK